ncbi:MAG: GTP-binding protein, partial [Deltaproteobacteria bacterium]|nr:GTP-binding protein [Deltaproteobacteria bacterium]
NGTVADFRFVAENLPSDVIRAKGFVFENNEPYLYSHVGKTHELGRFRGPKQFMTTVNRVVVIRRESKEDDIRSLFAQKGLGLLESSGIIVC